MFSSMRCYRPNQVRNQAAHRALLHQFAYPDMEVVQLLKSEYFIAEQYVGCVASQM